MFEKTGKCPLCNRTLRMKNGRMACEDCGYVLNMHNESDYSLNSNNDKNTNRNTGTTGNFNYNSAQTSYSERNDRANIDRADRLKRSRIIMLMVIAIIWILIMFMSIVSGFVADKSYNEYKEYSVDYLDSIEDINSIINKNNNIEVLNMDRIPDSELYQNFVTEVFGEDYTIVSPKQYASITYLHVYYYEDKIEYAIDDGEIQEFWYDSSLYGDIDDDIKCFTGLKYLNIEKDKFYYMDALDGLTQLTEVWSGNTVEELSILIENCDKIETIGICDTFFVDSLSGIENFKNVKKLYVAANYLETLTGLDSLTKLEELTLDYANSIVNFSELSQLNSLERLSITSNKLKNLSILNNMDNLTELSICESKIDDISELAKYKNTIKKIDFNNNYQLKDYSIISQMTQLEEIVIGCSYDSVLPDFSNMSNLKSLYLSGAGDVTNVGTAKNLTELTLESCSIDNGDILSGLTSVKYFKLKSPNSYMESLSDLKGMANLENLDISDVNIYGNIEEIFTLPNLKVVNMNGANVGLDFEKLQSNDRLLVLSMNNASINSYVEVQGEYYSYYDSEKVNISENTDMFLKFPNLQELYIADMGIKSVEFATGLKNIRKLDVSDNYISEIKPLASLEKLEYVWCGGNTLIDTDALSDKVKVLFE